MSLLANLSSNAILAKVRDMYGRRISDTDYERLLNCKSVSEVAQYLQANTHYSSVLASVDAKSIHRGILENIIKRKIFYDCGRLCRYDFSLGEGIARCIIIRTEVEYILQALISLVSGKPFDYVQSMPEFFNKHTKINLLALSKATDYMGFLDAISGSAYRKIMEQISPLQGEVMDLLRAESVLYEYLYGTIFGTIGKHMHGVAKTDMLEIFNSYVDFINFVRVVRIKRSGIDTQKGIIKSWGLKPRVITEMLKATTEEEAFTIMKQTPTGRQLGRIVYNSIDDIPLKSVYRLCKHKIRFSVNPSVVMIAYVFLVEIELSNVITIIEGVRYGVLKEEIRKLLVLGD